MGGMRKQALNTVKTLTRQKKQLLKRVRLPEDGLPGSLSMSRFRCGKKECHCATEEGHEKWALTYMLDGAKKVQHIPSELVDQVRHQVEEGKNFKEAINQIFAANAQLLVLLRKRESK